MSNDRYDGTEGNGYQPRAGASTGDEQCPGQENPPPRDPSNLRALQFDPSAMEKACAYMERNLEAMTRYQRAYARLQRERFVSLVAVGFTPEQALEVICRTSMFGS